MSVDSTKSTISIWENPHKRRRLISVLGGVGLGVLLGVVTGNWLAGIVIFAIVVGLTVLGLIEDGALNNAPPAGVAVQDIIAQVQNAIFRVVQGSSDHPELFDMGVKSLEISLQTVVEQKAGVEASTKLVVPLGEQSLKVTGNLTEAETQNLTVILVPSTQVRDKWAEQAGIPDVGEDIEKAINEIRKGIAGAESGKYPMHLTESTIELKFVVKKDGKISLVVYGEKSNELTHTVKLIFYDAKHPPKDEAES